MIQQAADTLGSAAAARFKQTSYSRMAGGEDSATTGSGCAKTREKTPITPNLHMVRLFLIIMPKLQLSTDAALGFSIYEVYTNHIRIVHGETNGHC
jgi:hypothetical protein